jgi:glycosyltransferase involved in cell wall biosynthesis
MSVARIDRRVVHYGLNDPRTTAGGVETFARNLGLVFEDVRFMTPDTLDVALVKRERLPVICDNHHVLDWPDDVPLIGFRHGMAARKMFSIPRDGNVRMAWRQRKAAGRGRTLWVACARWIASAFHKLHRSPTKHVIYHSVDLERFDGVLDNGGSTLVLHDGRSEHKGSALYPVLSAALPKWSFEPLDCKPHEVPDRMRRARAFVHLSRYEGNSIVCNEAMAMNLPCLFTEVGLMLDEDPGIDVEVVPVKTAFRAGAALIDTVGAFLDALDDKPREPRRWVVENCSLAQNVARWRAVVDDFDAMGGWR